MIFGIDTTTEDGRAQFRQEYETLCQLAPEIVKKADLVFPHEMAPHISTEPHFRRVWQHYREHMFRLHFAMLVESKVISEKDANTFTRWIDMNGQPSFSVYIMAR